MTPSDAQWLFIILVGVPVCFYLVGQFICYVINGLLFGWDWSEDLADDGEKWL